MTAVRSQMEPWNCVSGLFLHTTGRLIMSNISYTTSKDQVETAIYLGTLPYVDKNSIGIWGWSFGGFNTLMSMSEGRPVFKAGVAVAPPTSWRASTSPARQTSPIHVLFLPH